MQKRVARAEETKMTIQDLKTAEAERAALQSRLLDTQAGLTIWMERSKANAKECDAAYDAMCDIAQMLDCAEDWPAIKAALALLAVAA
jgi:hypothetical protein